MKTKNIKQSIKEHYFINPTSRLRVREIEKLLKLPLPSVIRYCKELRAEKILTIMQIGKITLYTGDRASENFIIEKKLFNIKSIYDSGLLEFIKNELSNPVVILFGSYSNGEDIEESDLDLYVETSSKKEILLEKFEKILKRKIQVFRHKNIREIKNTNLANNIINGIVLNNQIEVFR